MILENIFCEGSYFACTYMWSTTSNQQVAGVVVLMITVMQQEMQQYKHLTHLLDLRDTQK